MGKGLISTGVYRNRWERRHLGAKVMGKEVERLADMIGGTVLYGMVAAERQNFEREIERKGRQSESAPIAHIAGSAKGKFTSAIGAIRNLVSQGSIAGHAQVSS